MYISADYTNQFRKNNQDDEDIKPLVILDHYYKPTKRLLHITMSDFCEVCGLNALTQYRSIQYIHLTIYMLL